MVDDLNVAPSDFFLLISTEYEILTIRFIVLGSVVEQADKMKEV